MATNDLAGHTILVVEDQPVIMLDLKRALEHAGARVRGAYNAEDVSLSGAVLDGAAPSVADGLTDRGLPFVFHTGREPDAFRRWPHAPVLVKPTSAKAIVTALALLLRAKAATEEQLEGAIRLRLRLAMSSSQMRCASGPRGRTAELRRFAPSAISPSSS